MAKLKMDRFRIIALRKDRKRLLEHLQDSGIVQVEKIDESRQGFSKEDTSASIERFRKSARLCQQAQNILGKLSKEKKGLLDSFKGRREIDPDHIGVLAENAKDILLICEDIIGCENTIANLSAEKIRINTRLDTLNSWKDLDIPFSYKGTVSTFAFIGVLPLKYDILSLSEAVTRLDGELKFSFDIIGESEKETNIVFFVMKDEKERAEEVLRRLSFLTPAVTCDCTPKEETDSLKSRLEQIEKEKAEALQKIKSYGDKHREIKETEDYFNLRADKYEVIGNLEQTSHTFLIEGFIPEVDEKKLEKLCNRVSTCHIEFTECDQKDAPVKLKNNGFASPAQSIVTMYASPSHEDIDPTPVLAFFYYFFFGMMFSDAGYGLLFVLATAIMIKFLKPETSMKLNLKLFQYCGISTFFWGLIFGSFFGDAPAVIYNKITGASITMADIFPWPIIDPQKDALLLMVISIALGLIHILVGMGCKFYICIKNKDYLGAFFDTGFWMLLLIGLAVLAAGMALGQTVMNAGIIISLCSVAGLLLTQGRKKKGIVGKVVGGLASLYDITSYISDLLSYSRLLALGLTTAVMGQVFNMLSTMFSGGIVGAIIFIIIFIVGHLINFGLNALGSYVHTMRLQYVEMFSKFYEGGGKPFEPFTIKSKYIRIQEEKQK